MPFTVRLHFTAADLARTRVATVSPFADTMHGLRMLQQPAGDPYARRRVSPQIRSLA
ncbi:hypothetical protein [Micromonospora eburnea]|uniref:Uncharacterized protein n=1 Tax=Micromonospora eburnea TaxID=227316 RepID=A0A1C6UPZ7_9ACTN|nr:hypothetical protein [Micromonospora eburnea]SCL56114.1 hypothetical protein GA0070604_3346 [Micromonospora eburnea]